MEGEFPVKILYVADSADDARQIQRMLAEHVHPIYTVIAGSLSEARSLLENKPDFDLVMIDLDLPDGSGLNLLSEIRKQVLPVAVIVLTGRRDDDSAVAALKLGADDYFEKSSETITHMVTLLEDTLKKFQAKSRRRGKNGR